MKIVIRFKFYYIYIYILELRMKLSVITEILVLPFYGCIENIR